MSDLPDEFMPDQNTPWSTDELHQIEPEKLTDLAEIQMSMPILDEVIGWFDAQIAVYSSPEVIAGVNPSSKPEDVKQAVMFAQSMIREYKVKRNEFVTRFEEYNKLAPKIEEE